MSTESTQQPTPWVTEKESVARKLIAVKAVFAALAPLTAEERCCVLGAAEAMFGIEEP